MCDKKFDVFSRCGAQRSSVRGTPAGWPAPPTGGAPIARRPSDLATSRLWSSAGDCAGATQTDHVQCRGSAGSRWHIAKALHGATSMDKCFVNVSSTKTRQTDRYCLSISNDSLSIRSTSPLRRAAVRIGDRPGTVSRNAFNPEVFRCSLEFEAWWLRSL